MGTPEFRIEGITEEELRALPPEDLRTLVMTGEPISFHAGSAEVLAHLRGDGDTLVAELAHIDGGGEGVLIRILALVGWFARREAFAEIDWRVHAVHCARPNPKLLRLLPRRGFAIEDLPGVGEVFRRVDPVTSPE